MSTYGQGSTRSSRKTRQEVLERDNFECQLRFTGCTWSATEVHHKVSIAQLGVPRSQAVDPDDCIAVCSWCHGKVTEKQRVAGQMRMNALRNARKKLPQKPHPGER